MRIPVRTRAMGGRGAPSVLAILLAACGGGGSGGSGPAPELPLVQFADPAQTVLEGDGSATVTVELSVAASGSASVEYALSGTASSSDYTFSTGTVTFAAGSTQRTLTIPLADDEDDEGGETLVLTLRNPSGARLGTRTVHALTIEDCAPATPAGATQVLTDRGVVEGAASGAALAFWGIPYAAPPVGAARFEPPRRRECWSGVRPATALPAVCPQLEYEQGSDVGTYPANASEDCLYLNVWRPASSAPPRPVLVFLHGGGNQQGTSTQLNLGTRMYDSASLAQRGDAVVVTLDYRLGPLGFLAHPDLPGATNAGLRDQILALEWVRANAAAFGGDPARVLLFGESAGGLDTCALYASPRAAGLFAAAAIQSGGCIAATTTDAVAKSTAYAAEVGCTGATTADCLRSLTPQAIVSRLESPLNSGLVSGAFLPAIDGDVVPELPLQRIAAGRHNAVPLIVGTNRDETAVSTPPGSVTPAMVTLLQLTLPAALRPQFALEYPPGTTNAEARDSYVRMTSDGQFICPARRVARAARQSLLAPVYRYEFAQGVDAPLLSAFGAFHGLELFYLFQTLEQSSVAAFLTADDQAVASAMMTYWTRFAATGDPNTSGQPAWATYDATDDTYLEIDATPQMRSGLRTAACDLWDAAAS